MTWKLYWIQISVLINKVLLEHNHTKLHIAYGCFQSIMSEFSTWAKIIRRVLMALHHYSLDHKVEMKCFKCRVYRSEKCTKLVEKNKVFIVCSIHYIIHFAENIYFLFLDSFYKAFITWRNFFPDCIFWFTISEGMNIPSRWFQSCLACNTSLI